MTEDHSPIYQRLDDHEDRIRELEKINYKQEVTMANIEKSQAIIEKSQSDLKLLFLQQNKEQNNMIHNFMEQILDQLIKTTNSNNETVNKIRLIDRKELWGILALIIGFLISKFS